MNKNQAKEQLDKLMQEAERLKEIINAPEKTPEQRFAELIQGLKIRTDFNEYPCSIFFFKDDEWMVEYDVKIQTVWLRYPCIWKVFEQEYDMNYEQIKDLTSRMVEKHFGWKGVTTDRFISKSVVPVEKHFGLNKTK